MSGNWTKPPSGSRIDWSHPITRGLVAAFPFNAGDGKIINNVVNAADFLTAIAGSADSWEIGINGQIWSCPETLAANSGAKLLTPSASLQPTAEVTVFWRGKVMAMPDLGDGCPLVTLYYNNANTSPVVSYGIYRDNTDSTKLLGFHDAGGSLSTITCSGAFAVSNEPVSYALTRRSGATKVYKNGDECTCNQCWCRIIHQK